MKRVAIIVVLLVAAILAGYTEEVSGKQSPEELKYDLDFLIQTLEDVHPDLYRYTPQEEIYKMKQDIEEDLSEPLTRLEFYRKVAPLVTRIGDGHTYITYPVEELNEYINGGGRLFPLDVRIIGERLFVVVDYTGEIPPGAEILKINGFSISQLIEELTKYVSGEKLSYRIESVNTNFRALLWFAYSWEEFNITYLSPSGKALQKPIKGMTWNELTRKAQELQKEFAKEEKEEDSKKIQYPYYSYASMPELKTGVIDFRAFQDPEKFNLFLEETFRKIKEEEIEHLIIDIRNNSGGNSTLGDALLDYLTDKPWRQFSKIELKVSKQIKEYYKDPLPALKKIYPESYESMYQASREWYRSVYQEISSLPEGEVFSSSPELIEPSENPLRFHGKLYVLIGSHTFSSAVNFAATVKDYGIGTLIGEETGGLPTHFGDIYPFWLPNTDLPAGVSHKKFYRPSGIDDGRGVLPDIEVTTTLEDVLEGKDPVMEHILEVIKTIELVP